MKALGVLLLLALIGAAGWFGYREPYRTYDALKTASAENDAVKLDALIDRAAVRTALIQDWRDIGDETVGEIPENAYTRLARTKYDALVERMVDPILTPEGMHQLLTEGQFEPKLYGGMLPLPGAETDRTPDDLLAGVAAGKSGTPAPKKKKKPLVETVGYENINRFKVKLEADGQVKPVILTFARDGVWAWKLVRVGFGL